MDFTCRALPWLKHVLKNYGDYDADSQRFVEQWLEEIMSQPTAGRLVREYLREEPLQFSIGQHVILARFYRWLEGHDIYRAVPDGTEKGMQYDRTGPDQTRWRVEDPPLTSDLPLLDLDQALILREGRQIPLTPLENAIMDLLYSARGRVVTHRRFEEWAQDAGTGSGGYEPKHHIRHLREKLGDDPRKPHLISNRRGIGYSLSPLVKAINN